MEPFDDLVFSDNPQYNPMCSSAKGVFLLQLASIPVSESAKQYLDEPKTVPFIDSQISESLLSEPQGFKIF